MRDRTPISKLLRDGNIVDVQTQTGFSWHFKFDGKNLLMANPSLPNKDWGKVYFVNTPEDLDAWYVGHNYGVVE
jgi:hypothetical protein